MNIDRETIEQFKAGDAGAFTRIFRACGPALFGTVFKIVMDRGLSEDIVQETFIRFYKMRSNLDPEKQVSAYLTRTAVNLAIDNLRARKRERLQSLEESETEVRTAVPPIDKTMGDVDSINRAVESLPAVSRTVLVLRYVREMSYEEIAGALDISVSAAALRLKRGKEQLRRALQQKRERQP